MTVTDKPVIRQHIRMPATARPPAVAVKTGKSKVMGSPSLHADGSAGGGGVTSLVSGVGPGKHNDDYSNAAASGANYSRASYNSPKTP